MPPRHGKSFLISEYFPAWYLGKNPYHNIISTTYSQDLSYDFGRKVRNIMGTDTYRAIFSGINLSEDSSSAKRFHTNKGGAYYGVGVGGPLTGRGGDLIIIDDPHKNRQEANSEVVRRNIHSWFDSTLYTRQAPNAVFILVQTRWHEDDLAGKIISENTGDWEVINMPAINEEDEALWPERFDIDTLKEIRKTIGRYEFESLYQQHPTPQEGGIFKNHWWRYYDSLPQRFDKIIQSWDFAVKNKDGSDYTVGLVIGKYGPNKYLLDMVRDKLDFPAACHAVVSTTNKWPKASKKLIEAKANGPAVIQALTNQIAGLIEVEPQGDKIQRANAASPEVESGNWYIPNPNAAPWVNDFLHEMGSFPNGKNDDIVDAFSQAENELRGHSGSVKISVINRYF